MDNSLFEAINHALAAHGTWKARLRGALNDGASTLDCATVGRDDACDFGRFLHGTTVPASLRATPSFTRIVALHAAFHRNAAAVVADVQAGRRQQAEAALALGASFDHASTDLVQALIAWRRSLAPA